MWQEKSWSENWCFEYCSMRNIFEKKNLLLSFVIDFTCFVLVNAIAWYRHMHARIKVNFFPVTLGHLCHEGPGLHINMARAKPKIGILVVEAPLSIALHKQGTFKTITVWLVASKMSSSYTSSSKLVRYKVITWPWHCRDSIMWTVGISYQYACGGTSSGYHTLCYKKVLSWYEGIVIADWPSGVQKVMNLKRLYMCQYISFQLTDSRLQFKSPCMYTKNYQFAYRKIYCKNGKWKDSGIQLSTETIWQWIIMLSTPKRQCYSVSLFTL